jgi:hypothetical protein
VLSDENRIEIKVRNETLSLSATADENKEKKTIPLKSCLIFFSLKVIARFGVNVSGMLIRRHYRWRLNCSGNTAPNYPTAVTNGENAKNKVVSLHATKAHGGRESIALTHS